jgi:hypothetical protein
MDQVLFFALPIAIIGLIFWLSAHFEKKRREALRAVAENLGLEFSPTGDGLNRVELSKFHLMSQGHSHVVRNLMKGKVDGIDVALFDYSFTTGHGKSRSTTSATVVRLQSSELRVPDFQLRPENFFHRIGAALGYQDINLEDHPRFSKMFVLRGADVPTIRALFNSALVEAFEQREGISAEGHGERLLVYRAGRNAKPEQVTAFLQEAHALYREIVAASRAAGPFDVPVTNPYA